MKFKLRLSGRLSSLIPVTRPFASRKWNNRITSIPFGSDSATALWVFFGVRRLDAAFSPPAVVVDKTKAQVRQSREGHLKTQVQTTNLGHPPHCFDCEGAEVFHLDRKELERFWDSSPGGHPPFSVLFWSAAA
jgi:hypothetical protein